MSLKDKVVIITGASSGIGRATANKMAEQGAKIVVADFNEAGGQETVDQIVSTGGKAVFIKVDVSIQEQVENAVNFAVEQYGRLDVMFNNAGFGITKPFIEHDPVTYNKVVSVNQHGVYYGMYFAARKMVELGIKGVIINTASALGMMASSYKVSYNASKGAVVMMTKSAALDLAQYGIRVVGIAPGGVDTPILDQAKVRDGVEEQIKKLHMRKVLLDSEELANVAAFLASESASGINGQIINVDDGFTSFKSW